MANGNTDYGPSFRLAKMYRKTSKAGGSYFSGRLGGARVSLVKSKETGDSGEEIWSLLVSEAPQTKQDDRPASGSPELQAKYNPNSNGGGGTQRPAYTPRQQLDDEIPFAPEWR